MLLIIRLLLSGILFIPVSLSLIFYCGMRPFSPANVLPVSRTLSFFGQLIWGLEIEARNVEALHEARPSVIISNHQDSLDLITFCAVVPPHTVSIGKSTLIYIPFFGPLFWLSGNILIKRKQQRSARRTIGQAAEEIKATDVSIWIMPEGTRSRGRGLLPFKKGAFYTAISAEVPIVPVAISSYSSLNLNSWKSGKVIMEVLCPLPTKGLSRNEVGELAQQSHDLIQKKIDELDREISEG
jgi:1-acyl-sn-glycerol-3-phosphate acyltransferase